MAFNGYTFFYERNLVIAYKTCRNKITESKISKKENNIVIKEVHTLNYSLERLQSLFKYALNKELKNETIFVKNINMSTLLLHEANMLLVLNNLQQDNDEIDVAFYLHELENEIAQQINEGKPQKWFSSFQRIISHYKTRWIDGEAEAFAITNNDI